MTLYLSVQCHGGGEEWAPRGMCASQGTFSSLPKLQTERPNLRVFCENDSNGIANSEDPDKTAPLGAV